MYSTTLQHWHGGRWGHCDNTLQHTATYCNALQRTATHCNTDPLRHGDNRVPLGPMGRARYASLSLQRREAETWRERERERSKRLRTRSLQRLRESRYFFKSRMPPGAPRPPRAQLSIRRRSVCVLSVSNVPHHVHTTLTTHTCFVGLIVCLLRWGLGGGGEVV